jgi:predicted nuclease of restriction endonuclease-like RecB superfamily
MLPSDLLFSHKRGAQIYPRFLRREHMCLGRTGAGHDPRTSPPHRGELQAALRALEGDSPDYRIVRGFAHLALNAAEFTLATGELEPERVAPGVFTLAAERGGYGETQAPRSAGSVAPRYQPGSGNPARGALRRPAGKSPADRIAGFHPGATGDRYNLAQAQGLLYSALYLRLTAHRNVPGEYRRLFQHLKFHGLMYAVEGHLDDGYQIYVDGPASLFKQTRKYGLQMAMFLPALLRVSRWEMEAVLHGTIGNSVTGWIRNRRSNR